MSNFLPTIYKGGCACGQIEFEYTYSDDTKPVFSGFCHCRVSFICRICDIVSFYQC